MLTRLDISSRLPVLNGKLFGAVGAYEALVGRAYFAVDPNDVHNHPVVDLDLAHRETDGRVTFCADVHILKPADAARGNGALFYQVVNRGRKNLLSVFNLATGSNMPTIEAHFGDGFLMREGYTIAACGWQADVPPESPDDVHLMTLDVPRVPVTGPVACEILVDQKVVLHSLGSRYHKPYEPADRHEADAVLTVRNYPYDTPEVIPRDLWMFDRLPDGRAAIRYDQGFEPGLLYNLIYTGKDPIVMGLGFVATRDFLSFLKYETHDANPLHHAINRVHAFGASQSGRFLRHLLYQGFNEDEKGRKVMDGVMAHVAGGARGSFNHRFAQPSRHAGAHFDVFYATEEFPFTDLPQTDVETGQSGGLLDRCETAGVTPRIFYTNTSTEYWNRSASLIHTDVAGEHDVVIHSSVRIYHFSSTQHGPGDVPTKPLTEFPPNTVNFRYGLRALLVALDHWVCDGAMPPESRYGKCADGTLVDVNDIVFPAPNIPRPERIRQPLRLNWGDRWDQGIIDCEPPLMGEPFRVRVPQVDGDGNEVPGICMPEVAVPLGTFTGWRFRTSEMGATDALIGLQGMWRPFARTPKEREASGDVRLSIGERYATKEAYLGAVAQAALALVGEGLMLAEDVANMVIRAGHMYDWVMKP